MLKKIKEFFVKASTTGLHFPFVYDAATKKPSVTLLFLYMTFVLAFSSAIALHFKNSLLAATCTTIFFWFLAFIMYRVRRVDSLKINLTEQQIELNSNDTKEN